MNVNQMVLLNLIKQSQFDVSPHISYDDVNWDEVYNEASLQSVLGLIAPLIPYEVFGDNWQQAQYRQMANYIRYCHAEEELKALLDSNKIPFVILKGNAAAINYKDPSLRAMGDIDFLVPGELYGKAKQILVEADYVISHESELDKRHIGLKKNGCDFELHRFFSYADKDIENYIQEGFNGIVLGRIEDHEFPMLPKLANGLVLLDHIRNHLKSALGLRQVIDWMMFVHNDLDEEFWNNTFSEIASETGLDILAITVTRMCQLYLGLSDEILWCKHADERTCEQLIECLMNSGNFGVKNGRGSTVETVSASIKRKGLFPWLQYAGEHNWKAYHRYQWLRPLCWFYQIFHYAKYGIRAGRNHKQLSEDLARGNQRYELLKKLNIL